MTCYALPPSETENVNVIHAIHPSLPHTKDNTVPLCTAVLEAEFGACDVHMRS